MRRTILTFLVIVFFCPAFGWSAGVDSSDPRTLKLACSVDLGGRPGDILVTVDMAAGTANKWPATISESEITWTALGPETQVGSNAEITINRYTGAITIKHMPESGSGPVYYRGTCHEVIKRKF
jgi:hypothetical protein